VRSASRGPIAQGIAVLPGTVTSCLLLTLITVLLAVFADDPRIDAVLRPLYFGLLWGFFRAIGRRERGMIGLPYRLFVLGFLVLTLGSCAAAILRFSGATGSSEFASLLHVALERGGVFLLGLSLISYGVLLWVPELVEGRRLLRGQLRLSEVARNRMEQRLTEADRLHALGQLAAGVAHDLRNPLAIVRGAAEALQARARAPAEVAEYAEVMVRNIDKADRTIRMLLDLGKAQPEKPRPVDADALLAEATALVAVEARRRRIALHTVGQRGLVLLGDTKLLLQPLLNLLLNALQASSEGGEVTVSARVLRVHGHEFGVIAIADRGCGIQATARVRLFTPFFTTKTGGTGLGLLSSRRVVEQLGGRIGLYPRGRGGARAVLLLPAVPGPATSRQLQEATA
jgi:signal transduction histidine kinase